MDFYKISVHTIGDLLKSFVRDIPGSLFESAKMDYKKGIAILCGPPIMMKFGAKKILEMGFKEENVYLSMEKNMSCGIGKCGHCRLGTYYCCKDGPVFKYCDIKNFHEIWD